MTRQHTSVVPLATRIVTGKEPSRLIYYAVFSTSYTAFWTKVWMCPPLKWVLAGFPRMLESHGKSLKFKKEIFQAWKDMENDCGHGKSWNSTSRSWNFLTEGCLLYK